MTTESEGSITQWVGALKAGDPSAAQSLWERYWDRLVALAGSKLRANRKAQAVEDEEDAALSAFDSFCDGAMKGRYPLLLDRHDLWRLLVVITARKAFDQIERATSQKRGGRALRIKTWDDEIEALETIADKAPTPAFAAMFAEEYRRLLDVLPNQTFRDIAVWKMEGHTRDSIADRLGCSVKTVANKLGYIRKAWKGNSK